MRKLIVNSEVSRNNSIVSIQDSTVLINGKECSIPDIQSVLTKPLIVKLYDRAVAQVQKLPKGYLKGLSFNELVNKSEHLLSIRRTLQAVRDLNAGYTSSGGKSLEEKTREQLQSVFGVVFEALSYKSLESLSRPQYATLEIVTQNYIGGLVDDYDINKLYNPIKDCDAKAIALAKEFKFFDFEKYISKSDANSIRFNAEKLFKEHFERVESFRKFRDIAGDDLVNWGPHKFAAQSKKHGLKADYAVQDWADDLKEQLIAKGVKIAEPKKSAAQKLKEQYNSEKPEQKWVNGQWETPKFDSKLTQNEYVKLFKNTGEPSAYEIIENMDAETAASLLEMNTKNVQSKLIEKRGDGYQVLKGLKAIVKAIGNEKNVHAFGKLKTYFETNKVSFVTWDLLDNYSSQYSIDQFIQWVSNNDSGLDYFSRDQAATLFTDTFHTQVLTQIPSERQLNLHSYITDSFLARMTDTEKLNFLHSYRTVPKVLARFGKHETFAEINWSLSANRFLDLPYAELVKFFSETNADGETVLTEEFKYFVPAVLKAKDRDTAVHALNDKHLDQDDTCALFSIVSFDDRVDVLRKAESHRSFDLKTIFSAKERIQLAKIAVSDSDLHTYIDELPKVDLNKNIKNVKGRALVPLTSNTLKALSKESILKIIADGGFASETSYRMYGSRKGVSEYDVAMKRELYSRLTRKEFDIASQKNFDEAFEYNIANHPDRIALVDLMNENEIVDCCNKDRDFFRLNIKKVPKSYIEQFKDKELFKSVVGDRRNRTNDAFGLAIEQILSGESESKAA